MQTYPTSYLKFPLSPGLADLPAAKRAPRGEHLIFDFEVDFLLAIRKHPDQIHSVSQPSEVAKELVHRALSERFKIYCRDCGEPLDFDLPLNAVETNEDDFTKWTVSTAGTVEITQRELDELGEDHVHFNFSSLVVRSRTLWIGGMKMPGFNDPFYCNHRLAPVNEIQIVLGRLNDAFDDPEGSLRDNQYTRMFVNEKCGIHINVGFRPDGLALETVKKVVMTTLGNERVIDSLHTADRISGSTLPLEPPVLSGDLEMKRCVGDSFHVPWSYHAALSAYRLRRKHIREMRAEPLPLEDRRQGDPAYPESSWHDSEVKRASFSYNVPAWLTLVQAAPTLLNLIELQNQHKNHYGSVLDLGKVRGHECEAPDGRETTLGFHQAGGTTNTREVFNWIEIVIRLVVHAHEADIDKHEAKCIEQWNDPEHSAEKFLTELGCPYELRRFYQHKLGQILPESNRAIHRYNQDIAGINRFEPDDTLRPMLISNAKLRFERCLPATVSRMIEKKFFSGGYGQFKEQYLRTVSFPPEHEDKREKLKIGWYSDDPSDS